MTIDPREAMTGEVCVFCDLEFSLADRWDVVVIDRRGRQAHRQCQPDMRTPALTFADDLEDEESNVVLLRIVR